MNPKDLPLRRAPLAFVFGLVCTVVSAPASAFEPDTAPCPPATLDWIERADAALESRIEARACPASTVVLRITPPTGENIDVELSDVPLPEPAFQSVGRLRISPILEVSDFRLVQKEKREAFEAFVSWLSAHEAEIVITPTKRSRIPRLPQEAPSQTPLAENTTITLLMGSIVFTLLGLFISRPKGRKRAITLLCFISFLTALLGRLFLGPFAPHHINGQGPLWILGASEDPTKLASYGPGYADLFSLFTNLAPSHPDLAIFTTNAVLSALVAPLIFELSDSLGLDRRRAFFAAMLTAVDPISIRFGATEAYFSPIIGLTLGASVLLTNSVLRLLDRKTLSAFALVCAAALMGAVAARIHPIAWGPLGLMAIFAFAATRNHPISKRRWASGALATGVATAFGISLLMALSGSILQNTKARVGAFFRPASGVSNLIESISDNALLIFPGLVIALLVMKPRSALLPAIAALVGLVATERVYGQSALWMASYARLWLPALVIAFAAILPLRLVHARSARFWLGCALITILLMGAKTTFGRTTEQLEHSFFREALRRMPPGCRIAYVRRIDSRIVFLPEYALPARRSGPRRAIEVHSANDVHATSVPGQCLLFAHTSICTSAEGRPVCTSIEAGLDLRLLERIELPAVPSYDGLPYDRDKVDLALYRVGP